MTPRQIAVGFNSISVLYFWHLSDFILILHLSVQLIISSVILCTYLLLQVWYMQGVVFFGNSAVYMLYDVEDNKASCGAPYPNLECFMFLLQYGFRENHARELQTLRLTNTIIRHISCKHICSALMMDISKAFDEVWHQGLIYEMTPLVIGRNHTSFYCEDWCQFAIIIYCFKVHLYSFFLIDAMSDLDNFYVYDFFTSFHVSLLMIVIGAIMSFFVVLCLSF